MVIRETYFNALPEEQIHFIGKERVKILMIRDPVEFKSVSLYEFFF